MKWFPNAGYRPSSGATDYVGTYGSYWSSDQGTATNAYYLRFLSSDPAGRLFGNTKLLGYPVRCVRL